MKEDSDDKEDSASADGSNGVHDGGIHVMSMCRTAAVF